MDLSVHIVDFGDPAGAAALGPELAAIARAADDGGLHTLSVMDHYFQMEMLGGPDMPMLEGYTTLGYLAGVTSRVRLQLLVTGVTYRHPGLLAKIVTTLDVLSGGRAGLGIGAAWYDREHAGLGVPFPPVAQRFDHLDEALQIALQMWSDNDGPFKGDHYQLAETVNVPQSLTRPHPPIMIGGSGERRTLRLVARYADACNLFCDGDPTPVKHKLDVLARHCEVEGRDPASIRTTVLWGAELDVTAIARAAEPLAAIGVAEVFVMPSGPNQARTVDGLAALATQLGAIS